MTLNEQICSIARLVNVEPKTMEVIYRVAREGGSFGHNRKRGRAASLLTEGEILTLLRCVVISFLVNSCTDYMRKFNQNPSARYFVEKDKSGRVVALNGERLGGIGHCVTIDGPALQYALALAAEEMQAA